MPFQVTQRKIKDMVEDVKINIPTHQRPYIWKPSNASAFLITIMDNLPTLSLIIYEDIEAGKIVRWIEDGQQRYMTVKKFYLGEFGDSVKWNGKVFSDFTQDEKSRFENYPFTITTMEDVPRERRLALFQAIQEGKPLTNGQRFNAMQHSPLVKLAMRIMDDPVCVSVWGNPREKKDKDLSQKYIANAVAIAGGVAFPKSVITTSYDIIGPHLMTEFDEDEAMKKVHQLLSVYALADELFPIAESKKKLQWDVGKFTGYILHAMRSANRDWEEDKEMFANYIADVRRDKRNMRIIAWNKPATRNWNEGRWDQGINNLENQDEVKAIVEHQLDNDSNDEDSV